MNANRDWGTVTVRIAGEEHVLRSPADPEYTRACAMLVDRRIRELRERTGLVEGHRAAILAALSLADELFRAQRELETFKLQIRTEASELEAQIAAVLNAEAVEETSLPLPDLPF
jgi:cell division protein ZapA